MLEKENIKDLERTRYQAEPGFQAGIPHRPYRRRAPKREMQARASQRVKKGPKESKG
jgi:hypothetical protein